VESARLQAGQQVHALQQRLLYSTLADTLAVGQGHAQLPLREANKLLGSRG
jgi:hypothetical protein